MPNWCSNGVTLYGPPEIIHILITDLTARYKRGEVNEEGFLLPFTNERNEDGYCFYLTTSDDYNNYISFETKWRSNATSIFIMCYALGLTFEMWSEESGSYIQEEYSLTPDGKCLHRRLTEEEYENCDDSLKEDSGLEYDDNATEKRENLLGNKSWEPFEIDLSLLKRMIPCHKV